MNAMQWSGGPGHYEVWYLSLTDPASGVGCWIRYTMVAPTPESGDGPPTCSLWFMAMDPGDPARNAGLKSTRPTDALTSRPEPFRLEIGDAWLSDHGARGEIVQNGEVARWDLAWQPRLPATTHVHPLLRAARLAKTVLTLPHPDIEVTGTIEFGGRTLQLGGARAGQAHLWGSKHASRWAWVHCNDLETAAGKRVEGFVDGASVFVPRFGRELGPNTPVVSNIAGIELDSISPLAVMRNPSEFSVEGWRFEARGRLRRIEAEVSVRREDLVGVTYHDPDGELAYCYNSEVADLGLRVFERDRPFGAWTQSGRLRADGRAHFEYAQREPVEGLELKVR